MAPKQVYFLSCEIEEAEIPLLKARIEKLLNVCIHLEPASKLTYEDQRKMTKSSYSKLVSIKGKTGQKGTDSTQGSIFKASASSGFANSGVQCYRNSLIQAILHSEKIVACFTNCHKECAIRHCVACRLGNLATSYWKRSPEQQSIRQRLADLQSSLEANKIFKGTHFNWRQQQDAPEFYGSLVNAILESDVYLTPAITSLLGHSLAIRMTCPKCGDETKKETVGAEDFILRVKYQRPAPLQQLLHSTTFGQTVVEGRRCDKCQSVSNTSRTERILVAPEVLVVQLHRFSEVINKGRLSIRKDDSAISFPRLLDMTPYTESTLELTYELFASLQHRGSRAQGHYRTIAKRSSDHWEELNDMSVNKAKISDAISPIRPWTPYMLFYKKTKDVAMEADPVEEVEIGQSKKRGSDDEDEDPVKKPRKGY